MDGLLHAGVRGKLQLMGNGRNCLSTGLSFISVSDSEGNEWHGMLCSWYQLNRVCLQLWSDTEDDSFRGFMEYLGMAQDAKGEQHVIFREWRRDEEQGLKAGDVYIVNNDVVIKKQK